MACIIDSEVSKIGPENIPRVVGCEEWKPALGMPVKMKTWSRDVVFECDSRSAL